MIRFAVAGLLTLICLPAMAQSSQTPQAVCEAQMAPAYAKSADKAVLDCGCVSRFLTGRYGASDAVVIIRFFAAASAESEKELRAVVEDIGADRIRALLIMTGSFQSLGRGLPPACPAGKKP